MIVVWSGGSGTADEEQIMELARIRPGVAVLRAGPGWGAAPSSYLIAALAGVRALAA